MPKYFQLPEEKYLLSHSIGPLTILGEQYLKNRFLTPWTEGQKEIWPQWLNLIEDFRESLASMLGASKFEVCPQPNVGAGLAAFLSALPRKTGKETILMHADAFPTMAVSYTHLTLPTTPYV